MGIFSSKKTSKAPIVKITKKQAKAQKQVQAKARTKRLDNQDRS